jgi:hypothetical protein
MTTFMEARFKCPHCGLEVDSHLMTSYYAKGPADADRMRSLQECVCASCSGVFIKNLDTIVNDPFARPPKNLFSRFLKKVFGVDWP